MVSKKVIAVAYVQDRDIGKLHLGQEAAIYLRDTISSIRARITSINQIPSQLRDSPLLQQHGGPVPVYLPKGNGQSYVSVLPLYRIELEFTGQTKLLPGRVVTVKVRNTSRIGSELVKLLLSVVRKEF